LPSLSIFKANAHLMGHHINIEIEEKEDAFFTTSPRGYTNTEITFQWFQEVFEPRTRPAKGINQHRILVLDGHSTHVENYEFVKYAIDHNIRLASHSIRLIFSSLLMSVSLALLQIITSKSLKIVYVNKAPMVLSRREISFPYFRGQGSRRLSLKP